MENESRAITHVIFDCDGTIINFMDLVTKLIALMKEKLGINDNQDINWSKELTLDFKIGLEQLAKHFKITDKRDLHKLLFECVEQISSEVKLMPGIEKLIMHLHKHNIPMAVATGGTELFYELRTKKFSYLLKPGNFFSHVVFSDEDPEVANFKPHPDVFFVCAKRFAKPPQSLRNVLVIEDLDIGIRAAISAGMSTLFVPSIDWNQTNSEIYNCDLILQSLEQFQPQMFGLPPF